MELRYYKILQGYEHERDIIIQENELERAYGLFMLGGRWIFSGGPVDGKNIQTIVEDFHTTMGWNKEHKLDTDDHAELSQKGLDKKMRNALSEAKDRVRYLINSKQEHLIGKNVEIKELNTTKNKEIDDGIQGLANKFKV